MRANARRAAALRLRLKASSNPAVSICIPSRDRLDLLVPCLASLSRTAPDDPIEVIVGDTGSRQATWDFYERAGVRAVPIPGPFNFARACNPMAEVARGERLLFLNNDTRFGSAGWVDRLLASPPREVTGALIVYPRSQRVQQAGIEVVLSSSGRAARNSYRPPGNDESEFLIRWAGLGQPLDGWQAVTRLDVMAVSGAFLSTSKEAFDALGNFDEAYGADLQDVDYCLGMRERGGVAITRTDIVVSHNHAATRGWYRFPREDWRLFYSRWSSRLEDWAGVAPRDTVASAPPAIVPAGERAVA